MKQPIPLIAVLFWSAFLAVAAADRPNIVLVITDDQGYGDLGCTGNSVLKTPHMDRLANESSQLTDYHVAPTCSPTRSALLTGHWTDRTGVWHTINGRSMLRDNEVTLGQMLKDDGYATGIFGKWHLGDNYPYRPEDRGFTEVYRHGGGGVGQTPDYWDNAYFDGHYSHNGRVVGAKGFCTDVFFTEAARFIRDCATKKRPFLAYIAPNAPHGPLHAPQKYLDLYADQPPALAAFFAMISNIDDNLGATRALLRELGLEQNTVFIFTTDNGTASGASVFNAGMRGSKGSEYEGGHRVPFFVHWPAAGWNKKHLNNTLCHAVDIVPTLLEISGAKKPESVKFDGISLRSLLDPSRQSDPWPNNRILITDSQRLRDPVKWKQTAVMSAQWRLVNGNELYNIEADPGQQWNIITSHPVEAERMRLFYDAWWKELEPTFAQTTEIYLGHPEHPVVSLTGHDWIQEESIPWNQAQIRGGEGFELGRKSVHRGHWAVKVVTVGTYQISLRRWPSEADHPITAALIGGADVPGASKALRTSKGRPIPVVTASLRLDGREVEKKAVHSGDKEITFTTHLAIGSHQLAPAFIAGNGEEIGAYYTLVTKQP